MKKLLFVFTLFSIASHAQANPSREALGKISDRVIQVDLAKAIQDSEKKISGIGESDADYIFCEKNLTDCTRYVLFDLSEEGSYRSISYVLEYSASIVEGKLVLDRASDFREGRLDIVGHADAVKRLLPSLERDYEAFPAKYKLAYHPFNVHVTVTGSIGDINQDGPSTDSTNLLIIFSESVDSRVTFATQAYSYLVKLKNVDGKIVQFESLKLRLDRLLK